MSKVMSRQWVSECCSGFPILAEGEFEDHWVCRICENKARFIDPKSVKDMWYCEICDESLENYVPEICCSGFECGCRGIPIEPPWCEFCWKEKMKLSYRIIREIK